MTRTEALRTLERARRYIDAAEHLNNTCLGATLVGLPVTLAAWFGMSPWPGIIMWVCAWGTWVVGRRLTARARELHERVRSARELKRRR